VTDNHPSAWEVAAVAEMRRVAASVARRNARTIRMPADDIQQLLLVAVVRACRSYARKSADRPPRKYLNAAIHNEAADLKRKARVRVLVDIPLAQEPICPKGFNRRSTAEGADRNRQEHVVCNQTGVHDRLSAYQIIELLKRHGVDVECLTIWHSGVSAVEGGRKMGVAPGTFRNRVSRAREEARDILAGLTLYES